MHLLHFLTYWGLINFFNFSFDTLPKVIQIINRCSVYTVFNMGPQEKVTRSPFNMGSQKSHEAKSQGLGGIAGQGIPIFPLIKMLATSSTSHSYSVELLHPVGTHLPAVHHHAVPQKMPKIRY
jgi:hypothetical protein